ncbi:gamma-butyrobetaine dioxygenase-like [Acanthaster planci]|uniref:Gamma-butyrobetaine dioxygenase-like n=1 Tax=Acanthaster planci TaxID=133434 RepID=A0A8B7Y4W1_ACAPL|nr:gamma-butyrobetaine dioxygenase-like [Acanthaster planci]
MFWSGVRQVLRPTLPGLLPRTWSPASVTSRNVRGFSAVFTRDTLPRVGVSPSNSKAIPVSVTTTRLPKGQPLAATPVVARCYVSQDIQPNIQIGSLSKDDTRRIVSVTWSDGKRREYPFPWLLDNCLCSDCYHVESQGRLLPFDQLDITAHPESVESINGGDTLRVSWNRRHHSDFDSHWLRSVKFDQKPPDDVALTTPTLWGAEITESLPRFEFRDVVSDDQALFDFLKAFYEFGIVKIEKTPAEPRQIPIIAKRIGPMRETSFGLLQPLKKGGNQVEELDPDRALSYTTKALQLHTDMSCLYETTYMAFFHCIKSSNCKGGDSIYADGFRAAEMLRREDPDAFQMLTTNQQEFRLVGAEPHVGDFDHRCFHFPIKLDHFGRLKAVHYSTHARTTAMFMPVDDVQPMYNALQVFAKLLESPENAYYVKLQGGEMIVVNNHRVLHGRTPFKDSGERHLELGYVDWDHVTSRMRVLQRKLSDDKM